MKTSLFCKILISWCRPKIVLNRWGQLGYWENQPYSTWLQAILIRQQDKLWLGNRSYRLFLSTNWGLGWKQASDQLPAGSGRKKSRPAVVLRLPSLSSWSNSSSTFSTWNLDWEVVWWREKRLYLLKLLLEKPNVLLLDEPTKWPRYCDLDSFKNFLQRFCWWQFDC